MWNHYVLNNKKKRNYKILFVAQQSCKHTQYNSSCSIPKNQEEGELINMLFYMTTNQKKGTIHNPLITKEDYKEVFKLSKPKASLTPNEQRKTFKFLLTNSYQNRSNTNVWSNSQTKEQPITKEEKLTKLFLLPNKVGNKSNGRNQPIFVSQLLEYVMKMLIILTNVHPNNAKSISWPNKV